MTSLFRPQGTYGAGMRVPMAVVVEARDMEGKDREEEQGQEEQANLWTDKPPPPTLQPADCCRSHGKPYM